MVSGLSPACTSQKVKEADCKCLRPSLPFPRAPLSNVLLPGGRCVRALSLPLTLSEYLAAAELARGSSSSTAGALLYGGGGGPSYSGRQDAVCVVALGYSVPHRDGTKAAFMCVGCQPQSASQHAQQLVVGS